MAERVVVVAARDAARTLPALLIALRGEEVVVVDNASRDATAQVARAGGARVVAEPVPGRARARNRGVAATDAPHVLFTDADCRPRAGWAAALAAGLRAAPLCGGPVVAATRPCPNRIERLEAAWRWRDGPARAAGWWVTANLGARREALEAVGGFDERLRHVGEDVDLCLRARAAGLALGWAPGAVVEHPADTRVGPMLRGTIERARSQRALQLRHGLQDDDAWRHPGSLVRGDWALRHLGIDPAALPAGERRRLLALARVQHAARMWGSWRGRAG